jgi:hypothetical protein
MSCNRILDIECYDTTENTWAQAAFLVHGLDDVYWTDDPEEAANIIKSELVRIKEGRV